MGDGAALDAVVPAAPLATSWTGAEKPLNVACRTSLVFPSPAIVLIWERAAGERGCAPPGLQP